MKTNTPKIEVYRTSAPDTFRVKSFSNDDSYIVRLNAPAYGQALCSCPHNTAQAAICKHIAAVLQRLAIKLPNRLSLSARGCYFYAADTGIYHSETAHSNGIITAWHAMGMLATGEASAIAPPLAEDEFIMMQTRNSAKITLDSGIARDMAGNCLALNVDPAKHLTRHLHAAWNRSRPVFVDAGLLKYDESSPLYDQLSRPPRYIPTARYLSREQKAADAIAITLHNLQANWQALSQSA
jgi:hypothetical protein